MSKMLKIGFLPVVKYVKLKNSRTLLHQFSSKDDAAARYREVDHDWR